MKLGDIQGENVGTAISQMRGALLCLKALDKEHNDIVDNILNTMLTSSVEKFNRFFENISFQMRLTPNAYDAEAILHLAEKTHREFVASGEWTGIHNTGTTFTAGMQVTSSPISAAPTRRRWRRQGPKEGEAETLRRGNKTYFWCGKCRLWNTTHKTAEHIRGGPKQDNLPTPSPLNTAHVASDPHMQTPDPMVSEDDRPTAFYSSLPVGSFPSDTIANPFIEGFAMAAYTAQRQERLQCQRDINRLTHQMNLLRPNGNPPHSE